MLHFVGLKYDDLVAEESELVKEALRRLEIAEPRAAYDRAYRIRVAQQCSLTHQLLPKDQWVKPEEVPRRNSKNNNKQCMLIVFIRMLDIFSLILIKFPLNVLNVKLLITSRFLLNIRYYTIFRKN